MAIFSIKSLRYLLKSLLFLASLVVLSLSLYAATDATSSSPVYIDTGYIIYIYKVYYIYTGYIQDIFLARIYTGLI